MSFVKSQIQTLVKNLQQPSTNSLPTIITNLSVLNDIPVADITLNQTQVRQQIKKLTEPLHQAVRFYDSAPNIPTSQLTELTRQFNKFSQKYQKFVPPLAKNQYNQAMKQLKNNVQQKRNEQKRIQKINEQQRINLQKQINKVQQKAIFKIQPQVKIVQKLKTWQSQLQPLKAVLGKVPVISNQKLPQPIKLLDQYVKSQGYLPLGSVTHLTGGNYIGRQRISQGNRQVVYPYPINQIPSGDTPNILNNYRYFANKTINAWNNYVTCQSQFVNFSQKISTKQNRSKYVYDQISALTQATFAAQALATLYYYYFQIPIQNFVKMNPQIQLTQGKFLQKYSVGQSISRNPFLLDSAQGAKVSSMCWTKSKPLDLYVAIIRFLDKQKLIGSQRYNFFKSYIIDKIADASTYFRNYGIQQTQFSSILKNAAIKNVKKRKTILPTLYNNSQVLKIITKVKQQVSTAKKQYQQFWDVKYKSQQYYCYDYVWNFSIK